MSIRNDGQSIATIARRLLGPGPLRGAHALPDPHARPGDGRLPEHLRQRPGEHAGFRPHEAATADQTLFRVVEDGGSQKVVIGGVASMSVIVITAPGPAAWAGCTSSGKLRSGNARCWPSPSAWSASSSACIYPVVFPAPSPSPASPCKAAECWKMLLAFYTLVAAGVPVWMFLQSRDFINVHILYAGIAFLLTPWSSPHCAAACPPPERPLPAFDSATGAAKTGHALALALHHHRLRGRQRLPQPVRRRDHLQAAQDANPPPAPSATGACCSSPSWRWWSSAR